MMCPIRSHNVEIVDEHRSINSINSKHTTMVYDPTLTHVQVNVLNVVQAREGAGRTNELSISFPQCV